MHVLCIILYNKPRIVWVVGSKY